MSAIVRIFKVTFVLAVITALAFVTYRRGTPVRQARHPLANHLQRVRADAEELLSQVSTRIESFDSGMVRMANAMAATHQRIDNFDVELAETHKAAAQQKQALARFSELLVDDQGVVLPNGTYISHREVRDQVQFEKDKLATILERIRSLNSLRESAAALHASLSSQHERAHAAKTKLTDAKERLESQVAHIDTLSEAISADASPGTFAGDLTRLESDVAGLQDQLDAYASGIPELLDLNPLNGDLK